MNVLLIALIILHYAANIGSEVLMASSSNLILSNIKTREDWINAAKDYISNHKPYNVKKYKPYSPTKEITTVKPNVETIESTTTTAIIESTTIYSTTNGYTSTTELPEVSTLLLNIIGVPTAFEYTTTPYESRPEITEYSYYSTTSELPALINSTEATTPMESTSEIWDSTTELYTTTNSVPVDSVTAITTANQETTTVSWSSTTEIPFNIDGITTPISENRDSTTESNEARETTTEFLNMEPNMLTSAFETTTSIWPESTTDTSQTTTEEPFFEYETTTTKTLIEDETTPAEVILTTTGRNFILIGDNVKPKSRKYTYSSDVMPEDDDWL
ncbi:cell wall protein SED1 [Drosophila busckii]|uniref:cell wall protein SED1 n=1 Tax=Drosophila busckii TaxID=30019 RepID=UPI00083EE5A7|nr:cell wall protein SED1 [Drosophila busckii]